MAGGLLSREEIIWIMKNIKWTERERRLYFTVEELEWELGNPGVPQINSILFVIELRDNPVKSNSIVRIKFKGQVSKTTCAFFGTMIIKTLGIDVLNSYSGMSNKRILCELLDMQSLGHLFQKNFPEKIVIFSGCFLQLYQSAGQG